MLKSRISPFGRVAAGVLLATVVSGLAVLLPATASADSVRITSDPDSVRITSGSDDTDREHILGDPR